jgi:hypothetical protein
MAGNILYYSGIELIRVASTMQQWIRYFFYAKEAIFWEWLAAQAPHIINDKQSTSK